MKRYTRARGGFTLIELLVVISIIAVTTGLIVSGTMAFREASVNKATEDKFNRWQIGLKTEYDKVVDEGNSKDPPPAIVAYCDGDKSRARAVDMAARLRTNIPDTFVEATATFNIGGVNYVPARTYQSVASVTVPASTTVNGVAVSAADLEAAILLHLLLAEHSRGGQGGDSIGPGETTEVQVGGKSFTVLIDPRGTPVTFRRWVLGSQSPELDGADFAIPAAGGNKDPLDPKNLVNGWTVPDTTKRDYLNKSAAATDPNLRFRASNRLPSLIGFGKDKVNNGFAAGADDIIGYRLNRFGKKGK